jgi:hypothetical protein
VAIDNSQPNSATLTAPRIRPEHLSKAAGAGHEISQFRIRSEFFLHSPVLCFDELHTGSYTPLAYRCHLCRDLCSADPFQRWRILWAAAPSEAHFSIEVF